MRSADGRPGDVFCHECGSLNFEVIQGPDQLRCGECKKYWIDAGWRRFPLGDGFSQKVIPLGTVQVAASGTDDLDFEFPVQPRIILAGAVDDAHPAIVGTRSDDRPGLMVCLSCGCHDLEPVTGLPDRFECGNCYDVQHDRGFRQIILGNGEVFTAIFPRGSSHVAGHGRKPDVLRIPGQRPVVLATVENDGDDEGEQLED